MTASFYYDIILIQQRCVELCKGDKMTYKVFMKYYKMNVFKHLGINTLGELQEFVQWYNKYWKGRKIA